MGFEMKHGYIDVGGTKTFYLEGGSGPTVVLLHGASLAIDAVSTWSANFESLARRFKVVAFDQIGFGATESSSDGRYVDRMGRCRHALAFLDALNIRKAHLVGHSEGGFMAIRMTLERPELASKLVVVTSGSAAPVLGGSEDQAWRAASAAVYDYASRAGTEDDFINMNRPLIHTHDPELERLLREGYRRGARNGQLEIFRNLPPAERDHRAYMEVQERYIQPYLSGMTTPTLVLWGRNDPTVPLARGLKLTELISGADFHAFSRASHMVMWDRRADFNAVLTSWLGGAAA